MPVKLAVREIHGPVGMSLSVWCRLDRFDTIGAAPARKLSALAMCVLLTLPMPALLERLDSIIPHITSVWLEVGTQ